MSRVLAALERAYSWSSLVLENARLRRQLAARELTTHELLATSTQYVAGKEEGLNLHGIVVGKLLGSCRDYVDMLLFPKGHSIEDVNRTFAEMSHDLEVVEIVMYGSDDDDEESFVGGEDDEDEL